jgi:ParB-like chromosome segregation protein Spo0J
MDDKIKKVSLNALEIQKFQPNRYPFLMIEQVTELVPSISALEVITNGISRSTLQIAPIWQELYN